MLDASVERNLADAGCSEGFVREFESLATTEERLRLLKGRRKELLGGIHAEQRKLDCLDYLIWQLKSDGVAR